ncbi:MAG: hypothetical protein ACYST6_12050, partial [Planctomycetota bacterium]
MKFFQKDFPSAAQFLPPSPLSQTISRTYSISPKVTVKNRSKPFNSCQFPVKTAQKRADFGQFLQIST